MSLDILLGPMFAGKSSTLLSLVARHAAIGNPVLVIKHSSDTRYENSDAFVVTHDKRRAMCCSTDTLDTPIIRDAVRTHQVIIVDEAQFFQGLVPFAKHVVDDLGKSLYLIGLDGDFHREPFGDLLQCIPLADRIQKLTAFCHGCADGTPGIFTSRRNRSSDEQVIVGGSDLYETLCRTCYLRQNPPNARPTPSEK